jgi:multimeric flavodoxin WrbA
VPRLLVVHHTPSPALDALHRAVVDGAHADGIEGVEVVSRAALAATAIEVLDADGFVLGTPANLGYMSGALKHFFDLVYYPCLDATPGRPFGVYVHGDDDTGGAVAAIARITTGLRWQTVHAPVSVTGRPAAEDLEACWELGATVAASLSAL